MPRIVVLANAGSGDGQDRVAAIQRAFAAWGADPEVVACPGDELAAQGRRAVADGTEVLVAAGGDGTVSAAAGAVAGTRTALAVLPLGTLNHFAKDAGVPLDLGEAARVAVQARARPVDVAQVNGHVFVNNASLGLYPEAVRERQRRQAAGEPKPLAMVQGAGLALRQARAHHLRLAVDGRPAVRTTAFLFVGNNVYETALGRLGKRASLTGGALSLYTMRRPGRGAVLGLAARALVGRLDEAPDLDAGTAREIVVDSHRPTMRLGIDGEVVRLRTPLRFTVRPRALRLRREGADA